MRPRAPDADPDRGDGGKRGLAGPGSWHFSDAAQSASFSHVAEDLVVSPGGHDFTRWATVDLVNRRSRFQKGGISVFRTVVGIADVAGEFGLHMAHDWAEVIFVKSCRRSFRKVLSRTDLDEVDPIDLDCAAVFR